MWGFADIHTHPMAHLGFGGHLLYGAPTGALSAALAPCNGTDHGGPFNIVGKNVSKTVLDGISDAEQGRSATIPGLGPPIPQDVRHPRDGWPNFAGWPFAGTICHQQMHIDWIRRAYDGGLRLMSALAVNNRLLTWVMEARQEGWDDTTIRAQLQAVRDMVAATGGWAEVVESSADAERVIGENKLAVVLGVEVDQLELLISHDPIVLAQLEGEAQDYLAARATSSPRIAGLAQTLHDLGVRQVNMVHLADNVFGGAALYMDKTASNSHWLSLWSTAVATSDGLWPAVTSGTPDVDYKLLSRQVPFNRKTGVLDGPVDDAILIPAYVEPGLASHVNARGLTAAGTVLLLELWRRGILVDLDHLSAAAAGQALELSQRFGVPMIASHCSLRSATPSRAEIGVPDDWWTEWSGVLPTPSDPPAWPTLRHEGMRTDAEIDTITSVGGLVATATHQPSTIIHPSLSANVLNDSRYMVGTTTASASAYLHAVDRVGTSGSVALGTDMNGFAQAPTPSRLSPSGPNVNYGGVGLTQCVSGTRSWNVDTDGLAHYGLLPDLIQRWRSEGVTPDVLAPLFRSAQGYIHSWSQAESAGARVTRP